MADEQRQAALAQHLAQAGAAHGDYERDVLGGKYDEQWADWYAHYLVEHGWNDAFTNPWHTTELSTALAQAHADHRANARGTAWQDYYAARFAERA